MFQCRFISPLLLAIAVHGAAASANQVRPIPLTPSVPVSQRYQLEVDGVQIPIGVEKTGGHVFHTTAFTFKDQAELCILVNQKAGQFKIRPLRFGLSDKAKVSSAQVGDAIEFTLSEPRHLLLEIEGLPSLVISASPPETNRPDPNDPNVLYFGPGLHEPGRIRVKSNQTVYLDAGAKVYGTIEGSCVENVRVAGHGHLYGTKHTTWAGRTYALVFERSKNITIQDIGIRDAYWWVTEFLLCDSLTIDNINLLSMNRNNGGLMIDGCKNLTARNCLLMSMDDCICPHALNAAGNGEESSGNMLFEDLVLYNVRTGNAIRIGASFEASEVYNWTFRNIDILHRRGAALYADHSDWAVVRNLRFERINDESDKKYSVDMFIGKTRYSCKTGYRQDRGSFENLSFVDVVSAGGKFRLRGYDKQHGFNQVLFAGCKSGGKAILGEEDVEFNKFVHDATFLADAPEAPKPQAVHATPEKQSDATSPKGLVIDDESPKFSAVGFIKRSPEGSHEGSLHVGQVRDEFGHYAAAIFKPAIKGRYEVSAYWPDLKGKDENSAWIIRHENGYARKYINQNHTPGWHSLGTYEFDGRSNVRLVFPNYFMRTRLPVVADAVRFQKVD